MRRADFHLVSDDDMYKFNVREALTIIDTTVEKLSCVCHFIVLFQLLCRQCHHSTLHCSVCFQKASAAAAAGEKDSDSACSADMSNTDSGRGSNDDGSEPFRPASPGHPHPPHWDPSRGERHAQIHHSECFAG